MGWLKRKWGLEPPKGSSRSYSSRIHPNNPMGPYWHPIVVRVDKSILHAFERSLAVHVADILTDLEDNYGKVTSTLIIELSTEELYVDAVVRIEPHNLVVPIPAPQTTVPNPLQTLDAPPEVRINSDGKIVEL